MPRKPRDDSEAFGSDSFLDIVANMVGILIILVMVAGLRAKNAAPIEAIDEKLTADVARLEDEAATVEGEVRQLASETEAVAQLAATRQLERESRAFLLAQRQKQLDERRQALSGQSREEYDLRRALAEARDKLQQLGQALTATKVEQPDATKKIENYPTPISQTVEGREAHFQLRGNRITFIPMDELVTLFRAEAQRSAAQLRDSPDVTDIVGPIGGFRLKYTLERVDGQVRISNGGMSVTTGGSYARLYEFTLIPISGQLGETLEQALAPHSEFRATLREFNPRDTSVTLWTYGESFGDYRAIKRELYLMGFAVAGRPLPEGQAIGGSPQGSKSAAQ